MLVSSLRPSNATCTAASRLKLAAKAAGAAAGAMAGGLDAMSKEAARREFEASLWAVKPEGDWAVLASQKGLQVRGRDATPHSFEKVCFVENSKTDTQVGLALFAPRHFAVKTHRLMTASICPCNQSDTPGSECNPTRRRRCGGAGPTRPSWWDSAR
jgi:hypothetical protein